MNTWGIKIILLFIFVGVYCNMPLHGRAFADGLPTLNLRDVLTEAEQNNPEILAARQRLEAKQAMISPARTLPDPMLMIDIQNEGTKKLTIGDEPGSYLMFSAQQEIPFPGKLSLKGRVAENEAQAEEEMYRNTSFKVLAQVKNVYYDLHLIHRSIDIIEDNKKLLEAFEKTAEAKYSVGQGIQQDVLKAQVEISMLIDRLTMLEQKRASSEAKLNRLLNRPPYNPIGKPSEFEKSDFTFTLDELNALVLNKSPELKAAERMIDKSSSALKLTKKEYYPDFQLRGGYGYRDELSGMWSATVGITVPLYFKSKQNYMVREAGASLSEARQLRQATEEAVLFEVKDIYVMAKTSERLIELYEKGIIPQARLSLESARAGYEVGKVDFLTLLDNFVILLNYQLNYYEQLTNFEKALANLEAVIGAPL